MNSAITVMHLIAQLRLGAGRCVADLAVEQARGLKHGVTVCVSTDADEYWRTDPALVSELAGQGIGIQTLGDFFHRRPDPIRQCAARLMEFRAKVRGPFIVHAHTAMAAAVGYWAGPDALMATCHGWGTGRSANMDLEDSLAYQLCDSVMTYSSHWADRLRNDLAVKNPKVISMGVNLDRFPPLPEKRLSESSPARILTVCELTPRKGVDILLNALPILWRQAPGAELHIMGNGDAAEDLKLLAAGIDPGMKRIFFYGALANPYAHFGDFDLFVLPSRSDNLPIALLEAMLAGLPVVATAVGGVPEIIFTAQCGRVVPPESSTKLADAIIASIKTGRPAMALKGKKGERFVRDQLDVRKSAGTIDALYREALKHRRP